MRLLFCRLISERTVEENILKKANQKRLLNEVAIEGGNFTTAALKTVIVSILGNIKFCLNVVGYEWFRILDISPGQLTAGTKTSYQKLRRNTLHQFYSSKMF